MIIRTLNIKVRGSITAIDCGWDDGLTGLPAGESPLHVSDDQQARAAEEARKDRQHAEAYYRQAEFLLTSNEKTLHQKIADLEAQLKAQQAQGVPAGFKLVVVNSGFDDLMYWLNRCDEKGHLENCSDLIEPWAAFDYRPLAAAPQAEPAQAIEDPVTVPRGLLGAACAAITRKHDAPKTLAHLRRYTVGDLSAPQAEPQPEREPTTWSRYVAGMIACYLKWPDGDERTEAVAGIIERRRWSDRRTKLGPLSSVESESLQWLERLCEPTLYLDRLGPLRDYLRAHGIGTKGAE